MPLSFGPKQYEIKPAPEQVSVLRWPQGDTATLAQPVSVDANGRVSFTVASSGVYTVRIKTIQMTIEDRVSLSDSDPYDITDPRSYGDRPSASAEGSVNPSPSSLVRRTETGAVAVGAATSGNHAVSLDVARASFAPLLSVVASVDKYPTIDPTGVNDSSSALQFALNATPDGGSLIIPPGTYRASGLTLTAKTINIECTGALFVQASSSAILRVKGAFDSSLAVTVDNEVRTVAGISRRQAKLTFTSGTAPTWSKGDVVKIFSDDVIEGARPGNGTSESRRGEFGTVWEVVAPNVVYLAGPLLDTYTTNVRAARLQPHSVRIRGWASETPAASVASFTNQHLALDSLVEPVIESPRFVRGGGAAISCTSLYGGTILSPVIGYLVDDTATSHFGYGILDNSCQGLTVISPLVRNVRHAFTDDTLRVAANTADPAVYGRSRFATVIGGRAYGTSGTAWDTHSAGERHAFISCQAVGSEAGFSLRGRHHRIVDGYVYGCAISYQVQDEGAGDVSFGHSLVNCVGLAARLDCVRVAATTYVAGRLALNVVGGEFQADVRALYALRADTSVQGSRFLMRGAITSGTPMIRAGSCVLTLRGAVLDAREVSSGSNLAFASLDNTGATITGRDVECLAPSGTSGVNRFPNTFIGSGTYTLRDVDLNHDPSVRVMPSPGAGAPATGSRVAYFTPTTPEGAVATQ